MNDIKVSVICNVYNHGIYLRDALEGFVMQKTSFPFEVLVHDDASTDDSADIIREYEMKYPEIIKPIYQTVNQLSQGISIMRTFQIPRLFGKYTAICEGDDYWTDPLKLQKQYDFMESHPDYSLCACSAVFKNMKTGLVENKGFVKENMDIPMEEIILHQPNRYFQTASMFMKSEIYMQIPFWEQKFPIRDYTLALKAALHGKVHVLSDVMTVYRYYAENSWTVRMDSDEHRKRVCERMIEGLRAFDEATDHQYREAVEKRMQRHQYTLALMNHDYKALKSGELAAMYRARPFFFRVSDMLRCKHPRFYEKIMKPIVRAIKSIYEKRK